MWSFLSWYDLFRQAPYVITYTSTENLYCYRLSIYMDCVLTYKSIIRPETIVSIYIKVCNGMEKAVNLWMMVYSCKPVVNYVHFILKSCILVLRFIWSVSIDNVLHRHKSVYHVRLHEYGNQIGKNMKCNKMQCHLPGKNFLFRSELLIPVSILSYADCNCEKAKSTF